MMNKVLAQPIPPNPLTRAEFFSVFPHTGKPVSPPFDPEISTTEFLRIGSRLQNEVSGPDEVFNDDLARELLVIAQLSTGPLQKIFSDVPSVIKPCQQLEQALLDRTATYRIFLSLIFDATQAAEEHLKSLLPRPEFDHNRARLVNDPDAIVFWRPYKWDTVDKHCTQFPHVCYLPYYTPDGIFDDMRLLWTPVLDMKLVGEASAPQVRVLWPFAISSQFSFVHDLIVGPHISGVHDRAHFKFNLVKDIRYAVEKDQLCDLLALVQACKIITTDLQEDSPQFPLLAKVLAAILHETLWASVNLVTDQDIFCSREIWAEYVRHDLRDVLKNSSTQFSPIDIWAHLLLTQIPEEKHRYSAVKGFCSQLREIFGHIGESTTVASFEYVAPPPVQEPIPPATPSEAPPPEPSSRKSVQENRLNLHQLSRFMNTLEAYLPLSLAGKQALLREPESRSLLKQCARTSDPKLRAKAQRYLAISRTQ
jgi:hypothetical protein